MLCSFQSPMRPLIRPLKYRLCLPTASSRSTTILDHIVSPLPTLIVGFVGSTLGLLLNRLYLEAVFEVVVEVALVVALHFAFLSLFLPVFYQLCFGSLSLLIARS